MANTPDTGCTRTTKAPADVMPGAVLHRRMSPVAAVEGSASTVTAADHLPLAEAMLDGGEVVLLAIKPSLWFVVFDASRWLLFGVLLLAVSGIPSLRIASFSSAAVAQAACLLMVVRLGIALLRWVSRFYVLTNRRVMRLCGVFRADIRSCPLVSIRETRVSVALHERFAKLGTILLLSEATGRDALHWYTIAKCDEVHERILRAIKRARESQPRA